LTVASIRLSQEHIAHLRTRRPIGPTRIPVALQLAGLTQEQFAEIVGLDTAALSRIVTGKNILLTTAWRITEPLGVGVDDLWALAWRPASASGSTKRARVAKGAKKNGARNGRSAKAQAKVAA
jgi:transcriptional regulator with XRE-family HTH domain